MIHRLSDKRIGMASAVVLLWVANALNLQPFEFELNTAIAISQHRLPLLYQLIKDQSYDEEFRILECKVLANDDSKKAELQTAKIRVRVNRFDSMSHIESLLETKTRPSGTSERCTELRAQILRSQWLLESTAHTLAVLERDREREAERNAIDDSKSRIAVQLVGFSKSDRVTKDCPVTASLCGQQSECETQLAKLQRELDVEHSRSIGFLRFSGSPKQYPIVQSVGVRRGFAFLVLCVATWVSVGFVASKSDVLVQILVVASQVGKRNRGSQSLGIPFLGEVIVLERESTGHGLATTSNLKNDASTSAIEKRVARLYRGANTVLLAGMFLWICVALGRFALDSAWRQLFLTAPLAGISHVIGGVP